MSTVPLPLAVALKSSHFGSYLTYTDDSYSPAQGYVRVNGSNVFSPLAKFEVLFANVGTGVHLRCRKNNKYLRRLTASSVFISPDAAEPKEDPSNWECTLFETRVVEAGNITRTYLIHVQSQFYATAIDITSGVRSLILNDTTIDQSKFDIIDLESLVVLPKYVAFKGDNGKYLQVRDGRDRWWLSQFKSNEKGYSQCRYETNTNSHGDVYLKSIHHNKYLVCEANGWGKYINANFDEPSKYGFFRAFKIDANTVALRSTISQKWAKRFTNQLHELFCTISTSRDNCADLKIEEHVLGRRIYNTVFDLKNARIYDQTRKVFATDRVINNTSTPITAELKFKYEETKITTWTSSYSWMVGISVSAMFKVPFIGETGVTAETDYSNSYEMGETITTTKTFEPSQTVTVPPHTTIVMDLMATEAKYDVTYSYTQQDQLWDGNYEIRQKDDGVCIGMNAYKFDFVSSESSAVSNHQPRAYLSDSSVEHPKTVEIIPLSELSDPTRVQHPVSTTATTTTEQDLETPHLKEWIVAAPPPENNEEGAEIVA